MYTPVSNIYQSRMDHMDVRAPLVSYPTAQPTAAPAFNFPAATAAPGEVHCGGDYYCVRTKPGDQYFLSYYSRNAGIPGPLQRAKELRIDKTTFSSLRDEFIKTEYLNYAHPVFSNMVGAPVLPDKEIRNWNAFVLPVTSFSEKLIKKEKCGCGKKPSELLKSR